MNKLFSEDGEKPLHFESIYARFHAEDICVTLMLIILLPITRDCNKIIITFEEITLPAH